MYFIVQLDVDMCYVSYASIVKCLYLHVLHLVKTRNSIAGWGKI